KYSFLYVSPERLQTEYFQERLKYMPVSLIAVDEAHCISQWGYDFRPAYLGIYKVRELLPETTILALTASATPEVQKDICEKLHFKPNFKKYEKSFVRENLSYVNIYEENKQERLLRLIEKLKGTGIIYVRNRRKTQEWAAFLSKNNISADFYHAGLNGETRSRKQDEWIKNITQVMVCTNAFGMGIDKPDVRFVVHLDICESLEAYYQEAGRAGRDGESSYCVVFYDQSDILQVKKAITEYFPEFSEVKKIYFEIFNFLNIAYNDGELKTYPLNLLAFSKKVNINLNKILVSFRLLEQMNFMIFNESIYVSPKIKFTTNSESIQKFIKENPSSERIVKLFLRSYPGVFEYFVHFRPELIADVLRIEAQQVLKHLEFLQSREMVKYELQSESPSVTFLSNREKENYVRFDKALFEKRKENFVFRRKKMLEYIQKNECRSKMISAYFGEKNLKLCGKCDICRKRKKMGITEKDFARVYAEIEQILQKKPISIDDLLALKINFPEEKLLQIIRFLIDDGILTLKDRKLSLSN
ncbi:MAG: RecQ family ATP-dependent DNA helicase, partial [Chitinophagaceae bacterium]